MSICIGILFDIVGVAVTVANEEKFNAKATKKCTIYNSAIVAAMTVDGKVICKEIADKKSIQIVYTSGKILSKIKNENK